MNKLADFLEREGGHIAVLVALLFVFAPLALFAPEGSLASKLAEDAFMGSFGALTYAMKGKVFPSTPPTSTPENK